MDSNFDRAFDFTLRNEGGYSNHAADSGGPTKYGITVGTLSKWRKAVCTESDVKLLTRTEAKAIYKAWYWDALKLDDVESLPIAAAVFDAGVLFGVRVSAVRVQKVLLSIESGLTVDGIIGPKTVAAINKQAAVSQSNFIIGFQSELRQRVSQIVRANPKNSVFLQGWLNRVDGFTALIA